MSILISGTYRTNCYNLCSDLIKDSPRNVAIVYQEKELLNRWLNCPRAQKFVFVCIMDQKLEEVEFLKKSTSSNF